VAELMIAANSTWGKALAEAGIPALYRAQTGGKVRMTTAAAPHEGLGVDCYAWSSSPLRRYVDLVNQWQLIAWLKGEAPPSRPSRPTCSPRCATSSSPTPPTPNSSAAWSATGACAGCARPAIRP
jgi:exoribonuclease R